MLIRATGAGLALRADGPQAEKKETRKIQLSNCFFCISPDVGNSLGSYLCLAQHCHNFNLLEISEDHRSSPRDGKGKMFKLLETNGTFFKEIFCI